MPSTSPPARPAEAASSGFSRSGAVAAGATILSSMEIFLSLSPRIKRPTISSFLEVMPPFGRQPVRTAAVV
jgi:hypothetical protein